MNEAKSSGRKPTRRDFLKASGALAAAGALGAAMPGSTLAQGSRLEGNKKPPNIVVINSDDGGRHLGCYGVETVNSPNIDGLAATGVRFENAFCAAPSCSPSRSALTTGRYPHSNGVTGLLIPGNVWALKEDEKTTGALLKEQGYATYLFGKQHVTTRPAQLGFDQHRVPVGNAPQVARDVATVLREDSGPDPMYLEINFVEPHRPFLRSGLYEPDGSRGVSVPGYLPDDAASREEFVNLQGAVKGLDQAVGVILDTLEEVGLANDTLVLFTADNGLDMPRAKCSLYDPGIGVSLIARWPAGGIWGGRVTPELVSHVDVLPTLLEAVGAMTPPRRIQGQSFLPLLRGEPSRARDAVYAEKTFHTRFDPMRTVRTDRFKFIRNFEAGILDVSIDAIAGKIYRTHVDKFNRLRPAVELYDLSSDPLEQRNLAGNGAFADIRNDLEGRLWLWMEDTKDPLLKGPVATPWYQAALAERPD